LNLEKYYKVLGVAPGSASKEELKKIYRKLAFDHHPDRGGSELRFKEITKAYELVVGKRKPSKAELREDAQQQAAPSYTPPNPYRPPIRRSPSRRPPERVEYMEDFYDKCKDCGGRGKFVTYCEKCFGTGNIVGTEENPADINFITKCDCKGGYKTIRICLKCNGLGKIFKGRRKSFYWKY